MWTGLKKLQEPDSDKLSHSLNNTSPNLHIIQPLQLEQKLQTRPCCSTSLMFLEQISTARIQNPVGSLELEEQRLF